MFKQKSESVLVDEHFGIPVSDEASLLKLNEDIESDKKVMNALVNVIHKFIRCFLISSYLTF